MAKRQAGRTASGHAESLLVVDSDRRIDGFGGGSTTNPLATGTGRYNIKRLPHGSVGSMSSKSRKTEWACKCPADLCRGGGADITIYSGVDAIVDVRITCQHDCPILVAFGGKDRVQIASRFDSCQIELEAVRISITATTKTRSILDNRWVTAGTETTGKSAHVGTTKSSHCSWRDSARGAAGTWQDGTDLSWGWWGG